MKILFHERFYESYTRDPAAAPGRMEAILTALGREFEFMDAASASELDLSRVHGRYHIASVRQERRVFELGLLAAGASIRAAEVACDGDPAFALVRPPGHHAGPDSCWGFCYFNNVAVALGKLMSAKRIERAFIFDFDLHFGDGTAKIFAGSEEAVYFHAEGKERQPLLADMERRLQTEGAYDILAVSAGFDGHVEDWGGLLRTDDYFSIGQWAKEFSIRNCAARRFAVLEGGYNHFVLGTNVRSFLEGFRD